MHEKRPLFKRVRVLALLAVLCLIPMAQAPAFGAESEPAASSLLQELVARGSDAGPWFESLSAESRALLSEEVRHTLERISSSDETPSDFDQQVFLIATSPSAPPNCYEEPCEEIGAGANVSNKPTNTEFDTNGYVAPSPEPSAQASSENMECMAREYTVRAQNIFGWTLYRYALWATFCWTELGISDAGVWGYAVESNWGISYKGPVTNTVFPPDSDVPTYSRNFVSVGHFEACIARFALCRSYYPKFKGKMITGGTIVGMKKA